MYLKIDGISNETPVSFLTVGQLIAVLKSSEKKDLPPQKQVPEIFGLETLCELTGYSKPTIYGKTSRNEIPHFKRDSKLFFRKADILSWMTAKPIETSEEYSLKLDEKLAKKGNRK